MDSQNYKEQYERCRRKFGSLIALRDVGVPFKDYQDMTLDDFAAYEVSPEDLALVARYFAQVNNGPRLNEEDTKDAEESLGRWRKASTNESMDWKDAVYDFFQNCYHLKDWIKNDPNAQNRTGVEAHINSSIELSLCADICNGSKHLKLTTPRSGGNPEVKGYEASVRPFHGQDRMKRYPRIIIESNGQKVDAFDLAEKCMAAWDGFLCTQSAS